jgi:hypothetical protein
MSFGKLKLRLQALINRKDVTDEIAGSFVTEAIADLERVLRIGAMEALLTQSEWDGVKNAVLIPNGFLEAINLFTNDGELTQVDLANFIADTGTSGPPRIFVKVADRWLLKPTPAVGSAVFLHYYGASVPLVADTDENVWATSAFNAVVYTAAALAADFYQMEDQYAQRFLKRANDYVTAIQEQDLDEKWSGRLAIPLPSDLGEF